MSGGDNVDGLNDKESVICNNNQHINSTIYHLPRKKVIVAKSDSGATSHFIREQDADCLKDVTFKKDDTLEGSFKVRKW